MQNLPGNGEYVSIVGKCRRDEAIELGAESNVTTDVTTDIYVAFRFTGIITPTHLVRCQIRKEQNYRLRTP